MIVFNNHCRWSCYRLYMNHSWRQTKFPIIHVSKFKTTRSTGKKKSHPWLNTLAMAPHSSTFAWKIPWMEEPGGLQSMGSLRVGHNWATSLSLFTFMHWRRKWQHTPVFLPGESEGWGSLVGCRRWGRRVRHDWSDLAAAAAFPSYSSGYY